MRRWQVLTLLVLGLVVAVGAQPAPVVATDGPLPTAFHDSLGRLYMEFGRPAQAAEAYQNGLLAADAKTPTMALESCFYGLMSALEAAGQRDKLAKLLPALAEKAQSPEAKAVLYERAGEALETGAPGQEAAALDAYRRALAAQGTAQPTEPGAVERRRNLLSRLARLEIMTNQGKEGAARLAEAIGLAPDFVTRMGLRAELARAEQATGQLPDRLKALEAKMAADPKNVEALESYAALCIATPGFAGKGAEALAALRALKPTDQGIGQMLADTLATSGDPKGAAKVYEELLAAGGDNKTMFALEAAKLRAAAGEETAAQSLLTKCLPAGVSYDSPAGQKAMGQLYAAANLAARAIESYDKAAKGFAAGPERDSCRMEQARLIAQAGRPGEAAKLLEALVKDAATPAARERAEELLKQVKQMPGAG